ncbi:meiotic recombination protein DMC1 homolog isoform X1 [Tanacetum coccineum]
MNGISKRYPPEEVHLPIHKLGSTNEETPKDGKAIFYGYPETGSDDDGLDLSVDDFFLSGSSSDEAEPKCKVWHNPGALLENIIYPRAYTYEHQYNLLLDLASKMNEEPFRLLVGIS